MTITTTTLDTADSNFVLGETLRPLLTHAMGSVVEVFDTSGPAEAGPPPHRHPWEEIYVVLSGQLEVTVDGYVFHSSKIKHPRPGASPPPRISVSRLERCSIRLSSRQRRAGTPARFASVDQRC